MVQTTAPNAAPISAVEQLFVYFEMYPGFSSTAPKTLSSRLPTTPATNGMSSMTSRLSMITNHPRMAMSRAAIVETSVQVLGPPPFTAGTVGLSVVIMSTLGSRTPISLAMVSAPATVIVDMNSIANSV